LEIFEFRIHFHVYFVSLYHHDHDITTPPPSENNNAEIYRFQALYTLLNRSSSPGNILSANITLHQVRDVQNQTAEMLHYINHKWSKEPYEVLLSYAAMNYNINNALESGYH